MGAGILIDTNTAIEFLGAQLPSPASDWLVEVLDRQEARLSIINQIELLIKPGSPADSTILEEFIERCAVLPLSEFVAMRTIKLRRQYRIKLPDAIIAATALVYNLPLLTRNVQDFQHIAGLIIIDSHDTAQLPK